MAFNMTTSGDGWRLAGSLIQLGHEIAATYPTLTCLGTIGDAAHEAEGDASDHNPFVKDAHGVGVVRAIDIGGDDAMLRQLRQRVWVLYAESDNRIFDLGYAKGCSDNLINNTGLPFGTHVDDGDANHLHISVTRVGAAGYAPAIDDPRPWLSGAVLLGSGTALEDDDNMKFRMIRRASTGAVYAYNNTGMFWHVPDMGWVAELQGDPDCAGAPADVDEARFDALSALADSCVVGPNGQLNQILTALKAIPGGTK